jgi:UDP-glucose 4-epimerase
LAGRLSADPAIDRVIGVDAAPPRRADLELLGRTEFIRADIRNPLLSKLLPQTQVDTVVHCDVLLVPEPGKAPEQLHDINVIGSLQLLAACEKTDTVRTIVVRGSSAIYGAEPNAPEFFTEDMARRFPFRTRFQRDIGELENYFENFARRFDHVSVTTLRFQPTLGTAIDSPLTRYLHQPVVPTQLGYDPLLQFVHAEDAVGALEAVVMRPVRGPVNVAGAGSVSLSRLLRLAGKVPLPIPSPLFSAALGIGGRLGLGRLPPEAVPWLRNGLTIDCTRLEDEVGFRPRSTQEAVEDFVEELRGRRVLPDLRSAAIGSPASRNGRRRNARARTRA